MSINDKVKAKLGDIETNRIINKMDEPNDCVSQMAVTVQKTEIFVYVWIRDL